MRVRGQLHARKARVVAYLLGWSPRELWARGQEETLDRVCVTIVGSRRCSPVGATIAAQIAGELTHAGVNAVTGAGLGIEAAAMRGVLAARADGGTGRPVAVLPGGVDRPVPVAHADLIERIAAHGLVLSETTAIRALLDPVLLDGTVPNISLGSDLYLPRGYESGNVAAIPYDLSALPSEQQLRRDLQHFLLLYGESVAARSVAVASRPSEFNVSAPPPDDGEKNGVFQPKDSSDYFAWVQAHKQRRTRKHEELVTNFAKYAKGKDWTPITKGVHPRDLVLDKAAMHLLVEAKTVRANSEFAVREAIGQLFTYEYLYYPTGRTNKVALFSAPVGDLWVQLLNQLEIDCIWLDGADWRSSGPKVGWV